MINKLTIFNLIVFGALSTLMYGQNGVEGCGSTHYSDIYQPTVVRNLSDLPSFIQDSVKKHILGKVGQDFFALVNFESGLVIDYKKLVEQDPKVLSFKWKVPRYDLSFYISQKQAGIEYYCSRLTLDSRGVVLDQIYFPEINSNPQIAHFVQIEHIKEVAKKQGYEVNSYFINITENHFVLIFTRVKHKYDWTIEISAHSGQIIREYKEKTRKHIW